MFFDSVLNIDISFSSPYLANVGKFIMEPRTIKILNREREDREKITATRPVRGAYIHNRTVRHPLALKCILQITVIIHINTACVT